MGPVTDAPRRSLRRDTQHAMLGGVCAGMANFFGVDITLVRVAYVLISIFTAFAGIIVYLILWIIVPAEAHTPPPPQAMPPVPPPP